MISDVIKACSDRIKEVTGCEPITLDVEPAVMKRGDIFLLTPGEDEIVLENMISSGSFQEYTLVYLQIVHTSDISRQPNIRCNILNALDAGDNVFSGIFDRTHRVMLGANCYKQTFGTKTWVANGVLVTGVYVTLWFKEIVEV